MTTLDQISDHIEAQPVFHEISTIADQIGIHVYVVGGYVRDLFLDRSVTDIDFVVEGDSILLAEALARHFDLKRVTVYKRFGTAMIPFEDRTLEFVTARKESYHQDSRKPVVEQADLLTDLARRDFTINAMAIALNGARFGDLIDPYKGVAALRQKRIETPLEPVKTFYDDPLRILRAIRFATQLKFDIAPKTLAAIRRERQRLEIISQERITDELLKILAAEKPSRGFLLMDETSVLSTILPEIEQLKGVDRVGRHQHKDVFLHTLKVLDNLATLSEKTGLRFAALFHDLAKPMTKEFKPETGWTFHGHDELGSRLIVPVGKRLKVSNDLINYAQKLIKLHLRPIHLAENGVTDSAIRRLIVQAGDELDDLITLCRADITSANPKRVARHLSNFDKLVDRIREVKEKDRLAQFQSPVRGDEIMKVCNLQPGPLVGKLKKAIEEAILDGDIPNEHDAALDYLLELEKDLI
ncbi:HD domain-containing protein [candidate division KSB1 bacterium]|nr:HD domain-containing protein [candidate division KSB1 bacterium]